MKTGLENKRNVAILAVLLLVMAGALVYFIKAVFIGGAPPRAATVASAPTPAIPASAAPRRTVAAGTAGPAAEKLPSLENLDPTLHPELMAGAESLEYTGNGRNIFSMSSVPVQRIEPVKGPVRPQGKTNVASVPQGPPPPPPIDLTFFGYAAANGARRAFLLHGDDVYIAREGDVVDHHYKVLRINPLSIEVTDLLYNNTQTLPLLQGSSS